MCITMPKVVLHDILSQIVQKLGFIIMVVAILAAILAAILDFSVSSIIFACYPPDFHYRGANYAKSTVKHFIIPSRVYLGGTLTIYFISSLNTVSNNMVFQAF